MIRNLRILLLSTLSAVLLLSGCAGQSPQPSGATSMQPSPSPEQAEAGLTEVSPTEQITELEPGLSAVHYAGDYGFAAYLAQGGAGTDAGVADFLRQTLLSGAEGLSFQTGGFGCSTLSVPSPEGDALFGRNFDWQASDALIVTSAPETGYSSISTVNLDFLGGYECGLPEEARTLMALYAPLDGMNEKGLCVAVLMIQDTAVIDQNTGKPSLTTTTAVRLLLDQAADVDEAIALLEQYDLHSSMGMMVHFALADAGGRSVVVEYIGNEMVVTETPAATNFYLSEGEKQGVGTAQSHTRYERLMERLEASPSMTMEDVRDAMDSVSKDNFGEFESTEWTAVYNQTQGEVRYYHRENYAAGYTFYID